MKFKLTVQFLGILLIGLCVFWRAASAAPGNLDLTFSQDGKIVEEFSGGGGDYVNATAIQGDGKIIAAGYSTIGNRPVFSLSRYNPDGSLDTSFGDGGKSLVSINATSVCQSVAIQADGKIVAAGYIRVGSSNNYDFALVRYNPNGSLDTSFDGDGKLTTDFAGAAEYAFAVAIQTDGKIVATGYGRNGLDNDFKLARYHPDGSLDASFDGDGKLTTDVLSDDDYAYEVAIQPDGKIVAAGYSFSNSAGNIALIRYNPDGSLDASFDGDGKVTTDVLGVHNKAYAVAIQADGKIVAAGYCSSGSNNYFAVVRYNPDGSLDTSFDGDGKVTTDVFSIHDRATTVAIQADGKIVVVGSVYNNSTSNFLLVRYNGDGSLDTSFDGDGKVMTSVLSSDNDFSVALQTDGKIVVTGCVDVDSSIFFNFDFFLTRYNPDGSLDTSFDGDGKLTTDIGFSGSTARAVAIQADGKIVVAGEGGFGLTNGFALVRYHPNGSLDTSFDGDGKVKTVFGQAYAIVIQADGKIIAAGYSNSNFGLARYNPDGSLDTSFDGDGKLTTDFGGYDYANAVTIQADGKIIAAGINYIGSDSNYNFALARYNLDGSLDASFDGDGKVTTDFFGREDNLYSVAIQADGKIVAAGSYRLNENGGHFGLVRYHPDGSLDTSFDGDGKVVTPVFSNYSTASAVAIQTDGRIVAAGSGSSGSQTDFALVRYNPNGSLDTSFDGDGKVITDVFGTFDDGAAMAIQADGKIVMGGSSLTGTSRDATLIRYNPNGSLDTSYGTGGKFTFDMVDNSIDSMYAMTLDSIGRAVIVGESNVSIAVARVLGDVAPTSFSPFDFDGDGKSDVSIYRPSTGAWWYLRSSDGLIPTVQFGNSTDKIVPADFTGDGKSDLAVWRELTGEWFILRSENNSFYSLPFGTAGDKPVPADFDGDGKADLTVFRPSSGVWYSLLSGNGSVSIRQFGISEDVPLPADFDGDGKADLAVYRPTVSQWWIAKSAGGGFSGQFGEAGDKPVPADFTGDGKTDIAVWRPATGFWFILRSEDNSYYSIPFGSPGDTPAVGDYDGDGKADPTVFRPSNAVWYLQRTTSGFTAFQFGLSTDQPVPSAYLP